MSWRLRSRTAVPVTLSVLTTLGCAGVPTGAGQPFLYPGRIAVHDLEVEPAVAPVAGRSRIQFRLVRAGDDGAPIFWTAHLVEQPRAGGRLSQAAGGPLASGATVEIFYNAAAATVAFVTLYPGSTAGATTGDGTGELKSFAIEVR